MKTFYNNFILLLVVLLVTSCFNDLDTIPIDDDEVTSASVYDSPDSYKGVLAKLYAGLAVSGQQGPDGQGDISGIDEGFGQYLRGYYYHQEMTTDEALIAWNDQTIHDFHNQTWEENDGFINAFYSRIFYQISICNEFLRETTEDKLAARGVSSSLAEEIKMFRAEARFLRALSYWHALDMFRNVPFVTEADAVGSFFPKQASPTDLFNFIESELIAIDGDLAAPRANQYARADQAAAWMLLAKLYLNAEVYIGQNRYSDCVAQVEKVISSGYTLEENYADLFLADNHNSDEIIFPVAFDGVATKTWGGMTFIIHAAVGGSMNPAEFGIDGGWGGTRTTSALVEKFLLEVPGEIIKEPNPGNQDYTKLYVPGAYQDWKPENDMTVLTSVNNDGNFEGYIYFPADKLEFKFTEGPNWDVNWGDVGGDGTLDAGGDNLMAPGEGLYKINVDLNNLTYSIEKTDWGLIGSATPDEWNSDQDMTYNAEDGSMEINLNLVSGEIKFRANDDWALNYGDDGFDGLLEAGGGNIAIDLAGNYTIKLFLANPDYTYSIEKIGSDGDSRGQFYSDGQSLEIDDVSQFTQGYAVAKFRNVTSTGAVGADLTHPDTDFPMFRLADAYLMYAEAAVRGGGGNLGQAVDYVNALQERAFGTDALNISESDLTLDYLIDERSRELHWECHRRTDLVRFGRFSDVASDQVWPWKGGVKDGASVGGHRDIFPIPSADLTANPNLSQNSGY